MGPMFWGVLKQNNKKIDSEKPKPHETLKKHKKHKKHFPPKKPKYVLGPKDKKISDETMHLVLERGYLLAPSYDFVLKRFLHDAKHHFDDDGRRFFEDDSQPFEEEAPFIEDPTYSDPLEEISDESDEEFND